MNNSNISDKSNNNSTIVFKSGIWYTIGNFAYGAFGFLTVPIFTRILSPNEFGQFNNITAWYSILFTITTLGISNSVNRARIDYPSEMQSYLSTTTLFGSTITAIIYFIVRLFPNFFIGIFSMPMSYINIIFISLIIAPVINTFLAYQRVQYKYKLTISITLGLTIVSTILSILLVYLLEDKLLGRTLGQYSPIIIIGFIIYLYVVLKGKKFKINYCKYVLVYCIPLIPFSLSNTLLGASDRIMITYFRGSNETALYSLAYTVSIAITLLMTAINSSFNPWLFDKIKSRSFNQIKVITRQLISIYIFISIVLMLFAPELLFLMGGKEYVKAKYVMPLVITASIVQFINSFYISIFMYEKKNSKIAISTFIAAFMNIILNVAFIPKYGYLAAAITTLVGYFIMVILNFLILHKMNLSSIYDTKYVFMSLIFSFIVAILCGVMYINSYLRGVVALTCIIVLLKRLKDKRMIIVDMIRKIKS